MPPAGARRPDEAMLLGLRRTLETQMDRWAAANPESWLASVSAPDACRVRALGQGPARRRRGRDRVSATRHDEPGVRQHRRHAERFRQRCHKATCVRRARSAASPSAIARQSPPPPRTRCRRPRTRCSTSRHAVPDRAAAALVHTFPADGLYKFQATLVRTVSGELFGNTAVYMAGKKEQLEISVNGVRVAVHRSRLRHERCRRKGLTLETPPIADQGRSAADRRRVRAAIGRAGRRSCSRRSSSAAGRHAHRHRLRRDDGAAPAGPGDRRTDQRDRRVGDAEPAQDLHLPSASLRARSGRCADRHSPAARDAGLSQPGAATTSTTSSTIYDRRPAPGWRRLRRRAFGSASRAFSRTRASCSASSRPRAQAGTARIASPTSIWRRGCRSSCGARCRTRSC